VLKHLVSLFLQESDLLFVHRGVLLSALSLKLSTVYLIWVLSFKVQLFVIVIVDFLFNRVAKDL